MKTVLFDLDGTLLPMEQDAFIKAYLGSLATKLLPHGYEPNRLIKAIWAGTGEMIKNNGKQNNESVFWTGFNAAMGRDCSGDAHLFQDFYEKEFRYVSASCGFAPQAASLISMLKQAGCRLVLATNPIFPAIATHQRIAWAGLCPSDFELITTYENSGFCKPNPEYYRAILQEINESAENCIMVGNDVTEDMIAGDLGMDVFLLTDCIINKYNADISIYPHGNFADLQSYLAKSIGLSQQ